MPLQLPLTREVQVALRAIKRYRPPRGSGRILHPRNHSRLLDRMERRRQQHGLRRVDWNRFVRDVIAIRRAFHLIQVNLGEQIITEVVVRVSSVQRIRNSEDGIVRYAQGLKVALVLAP